MKLGQKNAPFAGELHQRTLHKNLEFTAVEQYKLLRANLDFTIPAGVKCPVIGVTSSMRGEGKSTTSVNLSYVLAEKGSRLAVSDAGCAAAILEHFAGRGIDVFVDYRYYPNQLVYHKVFDALEKIKLTHRVIVGA